METIRKINDELAISGQITTEQLQQIAQEGYRSVLNLRSPNELNFLSSEKQQAESLGLYYINLPLQAEKIDSELAAKVIAQIDDIPKPTLVHCDSAMRAAAMALIHIATRHGTTLEGAVNQARQLELI